MARNRQRTCTYSFAGQERYPSRRLVITTGARSPLEILIPRTGYKEYVTGRKHMARLGDWRHNKDEEMELDGIGGVNILVKADVHRSGIPTTSSFPLYHRPPSCSNSWQQY